MIDAAQQVVFGNVVFEIERVEKLSLISSEFFNSILSKAVAKLKLRKMAARDPI